MEINRLEDKIGKNTNPIKMKKTYLVKNPPNYYKSNELTTREKDVLKLLLKGCSRKEIADALCIELCTVRTHCNNIYLKTGYSTQAKLIAGLTEKNITRI